MNKLTIAKIKCRLGFHAWESFGDNLKGMDDNKPVTIIWWVCQRCAKSELKCILPNGHINRK